MVMNNFENSLFIPKPWILATMMLRSTMIYQIVAHFCNSYSIVPYMQLANSVMIPEELLCSGKPLLKIILIFQIKDYV